ncbi:MerR family transcriptional regulator [Nocardioides zeae]|uniref:MerR family transcriptional regulator n=1 Tax=Nocardioides imazamoxiresistens TaxID=3231893 RepID=A0ABU3PVI1_9ACTN|nr:MerR family transcriptional regulator [Nocardioides zeae]MDT9592881.1 MerR family transcriptional regulator [Nocardioides zeae]
MESIGELARRTGTSRRMLRHWEAEGLLEPAGVDPRTGRRHYAASQAGRVRAIAGLRALGFGLDAIADLLDQGLSESRLVELLRRREAELVDRVAADTAALATVRERLRSMEASRSTIASTFALSSLAAVELQGVVETVEDETEIPDAVGRLLAVLGADAAAPDRDVVLGFDGTTHERTIVVAAALVGAAPPAATRTISFPSAERAAVVRLGERPGSTADAWIALDAELEVNELRATGPYRQTLHPDGSVTLAVAVNGIVDPADD